MKCSVPQPARGVENHTDNLFKLLFGARLAVSHLFLVFSLSFLASYINSAFRIVLTHCSVPA